MTETKRRRVIYATDDEWAAWTARAAERNMSISAYIREVMLGRAPMAKQTPKEVGIDRTIKEMQSMERQLGSVLAGPVGYESINSRPFSPAPKKK